MTNGDDKGQGIDTTLLDRRVADILDRLLRERGLPTAGSGSSGGGMDAWQQSVEHRLNSIQAEILDVRNELRALRSDMWSQFRWMMGVVIAAFIGLLGTMAKGFGWL